MIPLVVIKCRHRPNTRFFFTRYVFKKIECHLHYKREGFHSDNEKSRWGQAPYSGVYGEGILFYLLSLFSFLIFLKYSQPYSVMAAQ